MEKLAPKVIFALIGALGGAGGSASYMVARLDKIEDKIEKSSRITHDLCIILSGKNAEIKNTVNCNER